MSRWASEGVDQPWTIGEAIGVSMKALRAHGAALFVPMLLAQIVALGLAAIPALVLRAKYGQSALQAAFLGLAAPAKANPFVEPVPQAALAGIIGAIVVCALVADAFNVSFLSEAALAAIRNEPRRPGALGRALRRAPRIFGWRLVWLLALGLWPAIIEGVPRIVAGYRGEPAPDLPWFVHIAAILPPLVLQLAYQLLFTWAPFYLADDGVSLVAAMRRSYKVSREYVGTIFLYLLALQPVALFILLPLVGIVPLAIVWLGLGYGYVRATGRNDLAWFAPEFASQSIRTFLRVTLGALVLVAAGLDFWVLSIPDGRTSGFSVGDLVLRVCAISFSVAAVVVCLALLLPYILDRLEGERFTFYVAARHVRSQKSGFLTIISVLSICGVAMSSCALSSVVSVMGGFSADLKRKILGNNAHIVIDTVEGVPWADYDRTVEAVRKVPRVIGATPVVHGEVMASSASNLAGVIVEGIDPKSINQVIELTHNIEVGKFEYLEHPEKLTRLPPSEVIGLGPGGEQYLKGGEAPLLQDDLDADVRAVIVQKPDRPGLILGRELAKTLHVYVGDEITLVSPLGDLGPMGVMPRTKRFRVAAIFYSGMYQYDAMSVYTMLDDAMDYFATNGKISAVYVKVDDAENAEHLTDEVRAAVGRPELQIRDWREINKNLFSALKLERYATFIILSIAIMVASFCIVCTLLLMVTEKGKEIAILKAVGASDGAILRIFMIEGVIIGGIGTIGGVVTGLALCTGLKWFGIRLDPEVYYIDRLPITVNASDFIAVALAALTICTLSTVYPAYAASKLRPVDGLRYE